MGMAVGMGGRFFCHCLLVHLASTTNALESPSEGIRLVRVVSWRRLTSGRKAFLNCSYFSFPSAGNLSIRMSSAWP